MVNQKCSASLLALINTFNAQAKSSAIWSRQVPLSHDRILQSD